MSESKIKVLVVMFVFAILILSIAGGMFTFQFEHNRNKNLPVLGQVKAFQLTDSNGKSFSLNELHGKVWIASFIFTTCSDICPMMTKNMASLFRSFELVKGVHQVSFSVNPEYDSPDILKKFAEKFKADTTKWHFLTGPREIIHELAVNSFKLGSIEEPTFHSSYFCLVDRNGYIRGYYEGINQEKVNALFKDAAKLSQERF